jgi:tetratricopeptide (TPR) repeat protein
MAIAIAPAMSRAETKDRVDMARLREAISPAPDLIAQGKITEAEAAFAKILDRRMALSGDDTVLKLDLTTAYAVELCMGPKSEAATPYLRQAVRLSIKAFGEMHPETALAYTDLGDCLGKTGETAQSLERYNAYRAAFAIRRLTLGEHNIETEAAARNLAEFALGQDNLNGSDENRRDGLALFDRAISGFEKLGPSGLPDLVQTLESRAKFLVGLGRLKEAGADLDRATKLQPELSLFDIVTISATCEQLIEAWRAKDESTLPTHRVHSCDEIARQLKEIREGSCPRWWCSFWR